MNATETDKVMLPVAILDLLVQIALRTESGSALITGFRAGHPSLADKSGRLELRVEHPAVIRVEADRQ
jgi:hypothetical protein